MQLICTTAKAFCISNPRVSHVGEVHTFSDGLIDDDISLYSCIENTTIRTEHSVLMLTKSFRYKVFGVQNDFSI